MKTLVIYKSLSGYTNKYAGWIAEELQDRRIIVFAVGASPTNNAIVK